MERPRRKLSIWMLDCLKQFSSMFLVHSLNVLFAMKYQKLSHIGDECSWYFVTYLTDTFLTTLLAMGLMKLLDYLFDRKGLFVGQADLAPQDRQLLHGEQPHLVALVAGSAIRLDRERLHGSRPSFRSRLASTSCNCPYSRCWARPRSSVCQRSLP